MKKLISLIMVMTMILVLFGCSKEKETEKPVMDSGAVDADKSTDVDDVILEDETEDVSEEDVAQPTDYPLAGKYQSEDGRVFIEISESGEWYIHSWKTHGDTDTYSKSSGVVSEINGKPVLVIDTTLVGTDENYNQIDSTAVLTYPTEKNKDDLGNSRSIQYYLTDAPEDYSYPAGVLRISLMQAYPNDDSEVELKDYSYHGHKEDMLLATGYNITINSQLYRIID